MAGPKVVLVVDDSPDNIDLLRGLLRGHYRVKAATSGARALQVARKPPPPDLILLDAVMPEMDGYQLCRELKADPATAGIPVIFVTGSIEPEEHACALSVGAVAVLEKPVDPVRLLGQLHDILET